MDSLFQDAVDAGKKVQMDALRSTYVQVLIGSVAYFAKDRGWKGRLWHQARDEEFLEKLFVSNGVYAN